jgi:hypothetical protein
MIKIKNTDHLHKSVTGMHMIDSRGTVQLPSEIGAAAGVGQ